MRVILTPDRSVPQPYLHAHFFFGDGPGTVDIMMWSYAAAPASVVLPKVANRWSYRVAASSHVAVQAQGKGKMGRGMPY